MSLALEHGVFRRGHKAGVTTSLTVGEAVARKIFVDGDVAAGVQAFLTGEIQVQGDLAKVVAMPDVRDHLTAMGLTVGHMTPQQLGAREKAYTEAWTRIIKTSGFVAQ